MDSRVGQVLVDTYRIERLIAEGGMGGVYEATHTRVPKRFAVKFLNLSLADKTEALLRFRREAEIIAALNHASIVGLYDYNVTDDGIPYIVLEYLDGEHLGKRLDRDRKIPLRDAIRIMVPVVHALSAAHQKGIVHRDLKPENIILCKADVVKVVDFGIAKICGYDLTGMNSIIGTVPYMSPEQISGGGIDGRADQFAIGTILYEMLTGKMAFGGSQSVPEVAMRVMHHQPPFMEGVSQVVNETIFRAMSKEPTARFPDLEEFLRALLDAASRPDEMSVIVDEGEGLPELQGEATMITRPLPAMHDDDPVVDPPAPSMRETVKSDQASAAPAPRNAESAGSAERAAMPVERQRMAERPTEIRRAQVAGGSALPPPVPLEATLGRGGPSKPGVPYTSEAAHFQPLVTAAMPRIEPLGASDEGLPPLDGEATAITRRPDAAPAAARMESVPDMMGATLPPDAAREAPQLRLLHGLATVRSPIIDGSASPSHGALRETAQISPAQAGLIPTGGGAGLRETAQIPNPIAEASSHADDETSLRPAAERSATRNATTTDQLRAIEVPQGPAPSMRSPLTILWVMAAAAAAVVIAGLLVHHFM